METTPRQRASLCILLARTAYALLLFAIALSLLWLGGTLAVLGGSSYYLLTGLTLLPCAWWLRTGDRRGAILYLAMLVATAAWALWEVGLDGWALVPRLVAPLVLGLWLLTPWAYDRPARGGPAYRPAIAARALLVLGMLATGTVLGYAAFRPADAARPLNAVAGDETEWLNWGHDIGGTRFSELSAINSSNVSELKPAWTFRTGHVQGALPSPFEATPLKVRDTLYLCTPHNDIIALDAASGRQRWRYRAGSDPTRVYLAVCRGVAYYRAPAAQGGACAERIITATIDGRLIAVDARNGTPCAGFGRNGKVDLKSGLGHVDHGYYYVTSAPQIIRGKIVLGGWVNDNQHIGEPSGVIRAFDAVSGRFAWAFDVGRPDQHGSPLPGQSFTPGTPNSWAPISADEGLGLVYLPIGNSVPDWYGGQRRPFDDKFSSSVMALDAQTGALRWSFQTTHHDLWDYDVGSQPVLYDMPVGKGRVPALIQATKRGEIFVLDRRTGQPITPVTERPVPRSTVPGERAARTQPFSTGMPSLAGPAPTEARMWGVTPIDQAWCRVQFLRSRWEGPMTPPGLDRQTIVHPGYQGGSDWGSVSIDRDRDLMIANSNHLSVRSQLISRAEADKAGVKPVSADVHGDIGGTAPQTGTPYAVRLIPFLSPLGVPCEQPPYGRISAIDLKTRKLVWSKPFGSAIDSGPFGIPSMLPITMGVPNTGGSVVTRGGVTFIGATQDRYLRAYETATGKLLWQARLPAGGQATPMTYAAGGRQYVVIAAGGSGAIKSKSGDYVIAYALPQTH
ncbi:quinoprotein glucose dehydrogenase [Sphingobium faniae]|nr:quinoprotein glucose dehydrogenase [Sphingobium faniae]